MQDALVTSATKDLSGITKSRNDTLNDDSEHVTLLNDQMNTQNLLSCIDHLQKEVCALSNAILPYTQNSFSLKLLSPLRCFFFSYISRSLPSFPSRRLRLLHVHIHFYSLSNTPSIYHFILEKNVRLFILGPIHPSSILYNFLSPFVS